MLNSEKLAQGGDLSLAMPNDFRAVRGSPSGFGSAGGLEPE